MIAFDNRGVGSSGGKVPDTLDDLLALAGSHLRRR